MAFHPVAHRLCSEVFTPTGPARRRRHTMSCQALWQPEGWPCRGTSGTSQEGPCAPDAEAAAAQGLLPAAPRCCPLAKGAACTQPSKGTIQPGSGAQDSFPLCVFWCVAQLCFAASVSYGCRASNHLWVLDFWCYF